MTHYVLSMLLLSREHAHIHELREICGALGGLHASDFLNEMFVTTVLLLLGKCLWGPWSNLMMYLCCRKLEFKRVHMKIFIERKGLRLVATGKELLAFHKGIKENLIGLF